MSRFDHEPNPRQLQVGVALDVFGTALLPACIGVMIGFYAADQGMRWLPTMLGILLLAGAFALLARTAGRAMQGQAFQRTPKGLRMRKRVLAAVAIAVLAGLLRLVLFMVQQSSPLTELTTEQFETTFEF